MTIDRGRDMFKYLPWHSFFHSNDECELVICIYLDVYSFPFLYDSLHYILSNIKICSQSTLYQTYLKNQTCLKKWSSWTFWYTMRMISYVINTNGHEYRELTLSKLFYIHICINTKNTFLKVWKGTICVL